MSGTPPERRETPDAVDGAVLRVTQRLLDDYGQLPEVTVCRCVEAARRAVRFFGEEPQELPRILERIARADLDQIVSGHDSGARIYGVRRPGHHSVADA